MLRHLLSMVLLGCLALAPPVAAQDAAKPQPPGLVQQCPGNMPEGTERLTCACPAGSMADGSVWGTDLYTADSALCRAALHAGAVPASGGTVTVRRRPGAERYAGTVRYGVESSSYPSYGASIRFAHGGPKGGSGPSVAAVAACPADMRGVAEGQLLRCGCPAGTPSGTVWGSGVYTADSGTCVAARHAGAIGPAGGVVQVRRLPGQSSYAGSARNGVETMSYGAYDGSFRFER